MNLQEILQEFRRGLEELYGDRLVKVILFGSRARGDAEPDSDIDLLVVLRGKVDPGAERRYVSAFRSALCLRHDLVITCLYVSETEFDREQSPLLLNVRREGVLV